MDEFFTHRLGQDAEDFAHELWIDPRSMSLVVQAIEERWPASELGTQLVMLADRVEKEHVARLREFQGNPAITLQ